MWGEGEAFNMRHGHGLSAQGHQFMKMRLPWGHGILGEGKDSMNGHFYLI
jgi:hypothetical protein